jgi:hypothetical protein
MTRSEYKKYMKLEKKDPQKATEFAKKIRDRDLAEFKIYEKIRNQLYK